MYMLTPVLYLLYSLTFLGLSSQCIHTSHSFLVDSHFVSYITRVNLWMRRGALLSVSFICHKSRVSFTKLHNSLALIEKRKLNTHAFMYECIWVLAKRQPDMPHTLGVPGLPGRSLERRTGEGVWGLYKSP